MRTDVILGSTWRHIGIAPSLLVRNSRPSVCCLPTFAPQADVLVLQRGQGVSQLAGGFQRRHGCTAPQQFVALRFGGKGVPVALDPGQRRIVPEQVGAQRLAIGQGRLRARGDGEGERRTWQQAG